MDGLKDISLYNQMLLSTHHPILMECSSLLGLWMPDICLLYLIWISKWMSYVLPKSGANNDSFVVTSLWLPSSYWDKFVFFYMVWHIQGTSLKRPQKCIWLYLLKLLRWSSWLYTWWWDHLHKIKLFDGSIH